MDDDGTCWTRTPKWAKVLIIILCVVPSICTVGYFLYAIKKKIPVIEDVLFTPAPKSIRYKSYDNLVDYAKEIMGKLNDDINPCQDFYDFACGKYKKSIPPINITKQNAVEDLKIMIDSNIQAFLDEDINTWDPHTSYLLKDFYRKCLLDDGLADRGIILTIIHKYEGWPALYGDNWISNKTWMEILGGFQYEGLNNNFLFTYCDGRILSQHCDGHIIKIAPPKFRVPNFILMQNKSRDMYYKYMVDLSYQFGLDGEQSEKELKTLLDFKATLIETIISSEKQTSEDIVIKISDLQKAIPQISWLHLIKALQHPRIVKSYDVVKINLRRMKPYMNLIQNTDQRIIINFLMWKLVEELTYTSNFKEFEGIRFRYLGELIGLNKLPKNTYCAHNIKKFLPIAAASVYLQEYFNEEIIAYINEMLHYIKKSFKSLVKLATWMDKSSKTKLFKKLSDYQLIIGAPILLFNENKIESIYENLHLEHPDYYENVLVSKKFHARAAFMSSKLSTAEQDLYDFYHTVLYPQVVYNVEKNILIIPAAILQRIFYDVSQLEYQNYGALGWLIAHQFMHIFDETSCAYGPCGVSNWSTIPKSDYYNLTKCFEKQYSRYFIPETKQRADGYIGLCENIADSVGLKVTYFAYKLMQNFKTSDPEIPKLKYSKEQLLWIIAAQSVCVKYNMDMIHYVSDEELNTHPRLKVIGSVSNSKEFAADFKCPDNTKMNPLNKCMIF